MPQGIPQASPPCPNCGSIKTVISSVKKRDDLPIRYRKCSACQHTFKTQQNVDSPELIVAKCDQHRLTPEEAKELREMAALGHSSAECGLAFDINQRTAWNIINRRTYKDVK
tara:strand:+ start:2459 stop:2794 length:336 start_codon:yes stop_codon:yes gene_type:complete